MGKRSLRHGRCYPDRLAFQRAAMTTEQATIDVLIVDDDRYVAEAYGHTLSRAGYAVGYAETGGECLEMLRHAHPRLVLLDVVLPDRPAVNVCAEIRSSGGLGDVAVSHVSGRRSSARASALRTRESRVSGATGLMR